MVTQLMDEPAAIDSLSSRQVTMLLRTLKHHRALLDVAHDDVRRLSLEACRPAYLVDFELIYRYMFRAAERPEWGQELRYLFDLPHTTFLIGPGTLLEINRLVYRVGFVEDSGGDLQDLLAMLGRQRPGVAEVTFGMSRLKSLLHSPNFKLYQDVISPVLVDEEALETARAALEARRPNASEGANEADAINWAAVIHMRRRAQELELNFHPYLLTATRPLLDESSWSDEITAPVSRRPTEAIYTEIMLEFFQSPVEAQNHTVDMAAAVAKLEAELRRSPAYRSPHHFVNEPKWDLAVSERRVTRGLREQLQDLTTFVTDPIVVEAQRVYDIAHLGAVSSMLQRGSRVAPVDESPQRLFDLIVGINAALRANRSGSGLAGLWTTALDIEAKPSEDRVTHRLVEKGSCRRSYLTVEEYLPCDEDSLVGHYAIRWPIAVNAEEVVRLFSHAFERHNVDEVQLAVGTDTGIEHFGADIPFSLKEVVAAACASGDADARHPEVLWIRVAASDFDLYADLLPPEDSKLDPVIGLFVAALEPSHIVDLYAKTSARYIFPEWLQEALRHIGDDGGGSGGDLEDKNSA